MARRIFLRNSSHQPATDRWLRDPIRLFGIPASNRQFGSIDIMPDIDTYEKSDGDCFLQSRYLMRRSEQVIIDGDVDFSESV